MSYGHWLKDKDLEDPTILLDLIQGNRFCGTLFSMGGNAKSLGAPIKVTLRKYFDKPYLFMGIKRQPSDLCCTGDCGQAEFDDVASMEEFCNKLKDVLVKNGLTVEIEDESHMSSEGTINVSDFFAIEQIIDKEKLT